MIKKFIKIKNVGKFVDFNAIGDISFSKTNIIYGENSAGKTTLSSVIRSLSKNNPNLLIERKTYGASDDIHCEVLCEDSQLYKFKNNQWSGELKGIEIFDEYFVDENIYTGLEISSEHQKRLYKFALGEENVALAKEIEDIKRDNETKYRNLNEKKKQLEAILGPYFGVDEFVNLKRDEDIEIKFEQKKQEINTAEAGNEIKEKSTLSEISLLQFPFDLDILKSSLQKSLKEISTTSFEKVKSHIEKLNCSMGKGAETWLRQGLLHFKMDKDKKCPFCQKKLKENESIIQLYQQYFNEEYKNLKEEIEERIRELESFSIEEDFSRRGTSVFQNETLIEFWKQHLPIKNIPNINLEYYSKNIKLKFNESIQLIKKKLKSLSEPVTVDSISQLKDFQNEFNDKIKIYNLAVKDWNAKINELKNKQPNLQQLRWELSKLELSKKRWDTNIVELCDDYKNTKEAIKSNQTLVDEKSKQLKSGVSEKIEAYGKLVNEYLEKFGVPFKIQESRAAYKGKSKEPYLEYDFTLGEYKIDPLESTKHTLSGGDKNALALAFFLAKVNSDSELGQKIIVFDDPVTSLDRNRRTRTVECIRDLVNKAKQVIIFTHYDIFAFDLYEYFKNIGESPKTLQIQDGKIKEWNIAEQMRHPYFIRISKLEDFLEGKESISSHEARELIRLVLEDALKFRYFKYFEELGENCRLGPMISKLREKIEKDTSFKFKNPDSKEVLKELGNLCDFSGVSHHGDIDRPYRSVESLEEIKNYVKSTLKIVYEWL